MQYYRIMLRDGGSAMVDALQAQRLIRQGRAISVKLIGHGSPLYQRRCLQPAAGPNYRVK